MRWSRKWGNGHDHGLVTGKNIRHAQMDSAQFARPVTVPIYPGWRVGGE